MAILKLRPVKKPDQISSYWKRERSVLTAVFFFGILCNGAMSVWPILQGRLIDAIIAKSPLRLVWQQAAFFVVVVLLIQLMRYFKRYYVRLFANRTSAAMRMMLYNNIMHRGILELSQEQTGDLMTKAVSDVDICVEGMRKVLTEIFDTGVLMLSYLISLLVYDWKLTIVSCLFVPVAMWLAESLKNFIVKFSKAARVQSSRVASFTYYNIEHTVLLRVNGLEGKNRQAYFRELDDLEMKSIKANILENSMQPVYNVIALLGIVFFLYFGGSNVINGLWTVGMFSTYITIFIALTTKDSKASKLFNTYQKATVSWQRIKPYLTAYQEAERSDRGSAAESSLVVRDLCFSYPTEPNLILDHLNFTAKAGELIGITGPVACGKSSLGIALQGLYPYLGSIRLAGRELRDYSKVERSNRISYLGHQPQLLSDTLYRNITLGVEGDISAVLRDVCFEEDLLTMPEDIQTLVGSSGIRLSGGQQARIALARALYHHGALLILDDPFSAVDMKTEQLILNNLRLHYTDCVILLVSHRLTVFPLADQIILLHNDHTAEYGTHQSLLASSALYASIYQLQTGGDNHEA